MSDLRGGLILVSMGLMVMLGSSVSAASPVPALPHSNIAELITFVPPTADSVGFTDWGRIKASQGAQDVTGASPMDDKLRVVLSTGRDEALASGFGLAHLREHFGTWAFDALDLDWEAAIQGDGPPLFVLRLRDGFDLAPVAALFDSRGFTTAEVPGGTLRTHEMTLGDDWLRASEFGILNTVFLDDGRTLLLSGDQDLVREIAANHGAFPAITALDSTASVLDGASAALLLPGVATCLGFAALPMDAADLLASPDLSFPTSGLHPYAVLGIGYGRPDWDPVGRIAFGYVDPKDADADLAPRQTLADTGISQRVGQPYADAVFGVVDGRVDGAALILDVAPVEDAPRRLFDMVWVRDMIFAGC